MPAKVLPDERDFKQLESELLRLGFRHVTNIEFQKDFERLDLKAPRPRPGRETGFNFTANGLTVKVWTTWLIGKNEARETDEGWVLIAAGDKAVYFSHPLHRTKNFNLNLLRQAWIARWRALHRPLCPKCKNFMDIVSGRALKARYWRCVRITAHTDRKPACLDWDSGLPKRASQYVKTLRRRRARYYAKLLKQGKKPGAAIRRRIGWKIGRPENIVL